MGNESSQYEGGEGRGWGGGGGGGGGGSLPSQPLLPFIY